MSLKLNLWLDDGLSGQDKRAMKYFTDDSKVKIQGIMSSLVADFSKLGSSFVFDVIWGVTGEALELPNLVLIYFRANPSSTLTKQFNGASTPPVNAAGFTVSVNDVTLSEVYVEMNFPEEKIARIALHEMMHNRTGMGDEMHDPLKGGAGIARSPTQGQESVTAKNAEIVTKSLLKRIPQFVRKWN